MLNIRFLGRGKGGDPTGIFKLIFARTWLSREGCGAIYAGVLRQVDGNCPTEHFWKEEMGGNKGVGVPYRRRLFTVDNIT
jgi:hypothetical protein